MYTLETIIKLLDDVAKRGSLSNYGETYPNAECCYDAIETLKRMQKYYNIPFTAFIPRTLIDCPVCHGTTIVSRIIDHKPNGDSIWGDEQCYFCNGRGKVAGS